MENERLQGLEPYELKDSRTVLRREKISNYLDLVVKNLFGNEKHPNILISFLNVCIKPSSPITEVNIKNTELTKEYIEESFSRLDVLVTTESGEVINIEMQREDEKNMIKRNLYYWSKIFSSEYKGKGRYSSLSKTICINMLNFNILDNKNYHNVFRLKEVKSNEELTDTMELHFIELPKIDTSMKIKNILEAWLYFIKQPEMNLEIDVEEIKIAKAKLCKMSADEKEREKYFIREQSMIQKESALNFAEEKGRKEGKEEGREEGSRKKAIEIAKSLLDVLDIETIATKTGLSIDDIKLIK